MEFNRTKIFVGTNRTAYCIFPLPRQGKKSGAPERVQKGEEREIWSRADWRAEEQAEVKDNFWQQGQIHCKKNLSSDNTSYISFSHIL